MSTVSIAELWWHKAVQHGSWLGITAAVVAGGVVFAILDPLLPKPIEPQHQLQDKSSLQVRLCTEQFRPTADNLVVAATAAMLLMQLAVPELLNISSSSSVCVAGIQHSVLM
jgi:hypothetical protein